MMTLCEIGVETDSLQRLLDCLDSGGLNTTNAWTCFSAPKRAHQFGPKDSPAVTFTKEEVVALGSLKKKLVVSLMERFHGACAYCRRPVGRYGFGWHIEHVHPKSLHPAKMFSLPNLAIGCVDCNRWKGIRVDPTAQHGLSIIDPSHPSFKYGAYLKYVHISTEVLDFIKYIPQNALGTETWKRLNFTEIERSTLVDSMNSDVAHLHQRINELIKSRSAHSENRELVKLLGKLKTSIYKKSSR